MASLFTHRKCNSPHCGCRVAHSRTWDDDGHPMWRCENCGLLTPVRKRAARKDREGMTAAQERLLARIKAQALACAHGADFVDRYEFKKWEVEVTPHFVSLVLETGRKGDEGTYGALLCRNYRHIFIGPNGALKLANAKYVTQAKGWFNAMNALTR